MSRKKITAATDSSTVILPQEVLDMMGVEAGDEIDVSVEGRTLIVRPSDEVERARKIEAATKAIFEKHRGVFEELAKGAAGKSSRDEVEKFFKDSITLEG